MPLNAPGDGRFLLVLYPQIAGRDLQDAKAYRRFLPAWDLHLGSPSSQQSSIPAGYRNGAKKSLVGRTSQGNRISK
jgi:hypothetical protein